MTETTLIQSLSPTRLQEVLQGAGYRVNSSEQNGLVQLLSATQGIGYSVRFGNPAVEQGEYVDYTYSCPLRVQGGELPKGLVETWNSARRFARLARQGEFLVLEMDVVVAGGVAEAHLRAMIELWDRLLQEFILYLRQYSAAPEQAGQAVPADAKQETEKQETESV